MLETARQATIPSWLAAILSCPLDGRNLDGTGGHLVCAMGHRWPVIGGIPVLLPPEARPTHPAILDTLAIARDPGMAVQERDDVLSRAELLQYVERHIAGTHGHLYRRLRGPLHRFPIPEASLRTVCQGEGRSQVFIDVGSHWGRWALATARLGFQAVALDPSLRATMIGRRIAQDLSLDAAFVVGDARSLPFQPGTANVVFSYSVLQHLAKSDVETVLVEARRVCRQGGRVLVQMPNRFGVRQVLNAIRQRVSRDTNPFRVRYWSPTELVRTFGRAVGPTSLSVDGFFSLNPRAEDVDLGDVLIFL